MTSRPIWRGRPKRPRVRVWVIGAMIVALLFVVAVGSNVLGGRPPWSRPFTEAPSSEGGDLDAAQVAQDFLRLVADSRRNADTAPLPCVWVTDEAGLLNPCRDELQRRWGELVAVERAGYAVDRQQRYFQHGNYCRGDGG